MQYRTFGRTGWKVSEIGVGTWGIGGGWGPLDDGESVRTLLYAFENGVNYVDTAASYGDGHAEEIIGKALREWKGDKIYVATKLWPLEWPSFLDDDPMMRGRYPEWYLREGIEGNLKRLGVERLDLFQLHGWFPSGLVETDWLEALNKLRLEGKIDRIGVSLRDDRPGEGIDLARFGLVDSHQVIFNLFDQRPMDKLFREGEKTGTAFIARVPFDSSSLIGTWTEKTYHEWVEDDVRRHFFRGERFRECYQRVQKLKDLCRAWYPSLAEAAMRFCLSDQAVSVVIPGMKTREEVELNIACSDGQAFPADLIDALKPHRWFRNFYL
jgi:aryl-alcohol dehydrogenase-like predicted oxidoreductase